MTQDAQPEYEAIQDDLSDVEEGSSYAPAPAGRYLARCIDARDRKEPEEDGTPGALRLTKAGARQWGFCLEFVAVVLPDGKTLATADAQGAWTGKSVWDNIVFSRKAAPRRKIVLGRLGGIDDFSRTIAVTPPMLLGRWAIVEVGIEDYEREDYQSGKKETRKRNKVTYTGYERAPESAIAAMVKGGKEPKLMRDRPAKRGVSEAAGGAALDGRFEFGANANA